MTLFRLDASIRVDGSAQPRPRRPRGARVDAGPPRRRGRPTPPRHRPGPGHRLGRRRRAAPTSPPTSGRRPSATPPRSRPALVDELVAADALLFAVPLYNFGVSQHFKTYVDLVVTDPRMAAGQRPRSPASPPSWRRCVAAPTAPAPPARAGTTPPPGCAASSRTSGAWTCSRSRRSSRWSGVEPGAGRVRRPRRGRAGRRRRPRDRARPLAGGRAGTRGLSCRDRRSTGDPVA